MAATAARLAVAAPVASVSSTKQVKAYNGLSASPLMGVTSDKWAEKTVSNGSRVSCMKVWPPFNNLKFETLSYLPPLTGDQIAKEIDYMLRNNWTPCLEFDISAGISQTNSKGPCYYDGRYWTMWKLPMFGCTDAQQVLREIAEARREYPRAFIRVIGFDSTRQMQCVSFIVHKP